MACEGGVAFEWVQLMEWISLMIGCSYVGVAYRGAWLTGGRGLRIRVPYDWARVMWAWLRGVSSGGRG